MKKTSLVLAITALLIALPVLTHAQSTREPSHVQRNIELGIDFGFNVAFIDDDDQEIFTIGLPASDFSSTAQNLRVGYPVGARTRLEPSFGFAALDDGFQTSLQLGLGLDYMYILTSTEEQTVPFVKAGVLSRITRANQKNTMQLGLTGGSGFRLAMGKNWGTRIEGGVNRLFKTSTAAGRWDITGSVGLSFMLE